MFKLFTLFFILMLVAACNQSGASHQPAGASHQPVMDMTQQNSNMKKSTKHYQTVKPHAAITMHYEFLNRVRLNEPLQLKLMFKVGHDVASLQVKVSSKAGLTVLSSQTDYLFNNMAGGEVETLILQLMPEQFGEHALVISATSQTADVSQSRSFEVPVNLYSNNQHKQPATETHKGATFHVEQNVISMPASESAQ